MSLEAIDYVAAQATMAERFAASPHTCEGGCGTKMLVPNVWCTDCEERRDAERAERLRESGTTFTVPARYRWATFDAPELAARVKDSGAIAKARASVATDADRIVLTGPAGAGKTVLAICILRALADRLRVAGHFTCSYTLNHARAHASLGSEPREVKRALDADVVVLDDLGAERLSPQSAISDVIHERHAELRRTILTSGFDPDGIRAKYGDGVCRRVFEGATIIKVNPNAFASERRGASEVRGLPQERLP